MIAGHSTTEGTNHYAAKFPAACESGFYRKAQGLTVSSLGLGTYLGRPDEEKDRSYSAAVKAALRGGVNFLDSAINYRDQRSERAIGAALAELCAAGEVLREEVVVCTKAGFLTPGAVPRGVLRAEDVVGDMHAMSPEFLADQIDRSRANLGLECIDVFYLHNPETQLNFVSRERFEERISRAFAMLEKQVGAGKICYYGTATWDGYRKEPEAPGALSLSRMLELAQEAGGDNHHFRFVQLPFNLAMPEAFTSPRETVHGQSASVLGAATHSGVTVVASATLMQAQLASGLPEHLSPMFPGADTDSQRSIQFTRSTPGIAVALVGMSDTRHVAENLGVSRFPPLDTASYVRLYQSA